MPLQQIYIEEAMKIQTFFDVMICLMFLSILGTVWCYISTTALYFKTDGNQSFFHSSSNF